MLFTVCLIRCESEGPDLLDADATLMDRVRIIGQILNAAHGIARPSSPGRAFVALAILVALLPGFHVLIMRTATLAAVLRLLLAAIIFMALFTCLHMLLMRTATLAACALRLLIAIVLMALLAGPDVLLARTTLLAATALI